MSSLIKNPNKLLNQDIILELGRSKNKNKVPQVDRHIQELEEEIKKLSPEEEIIAEDMLIKATKAVNDKIRSGNFSANEILFRRKQDQSEITISDEDFASKIENSCVDDSSRKNTEIEMKRDFLHIGMLDFLRKYSECFLIVPVKMRTDICDVICVFYLF